MYFHGWGVPQDFDSAHMSFNISSANGEKFGRDTRVCLEERMTAEDISEAERRARICMASDYTDCN